MINSGGNEDNIPVGEAFSSCAYILGTCSMIYKYNFKKNYADEERRGYSGYAG